MKIAIPHTNIEPTKPVSSGDRENDGIVRTEIGQISPTTQWNARQRAATEASSLQLASRI